jgi:hypothetical protein
MKQFFFFLTVFCATVTNAQTSFFVSVDQPVNGFNDSTETRVALEISQYELGAMTMVLTPAEVRLSQKDVCILAKVGGRVGHTFGDLNYNPRAMWLSIYGSFHWGIGYQESFDVENPTKKFQVAIDGNIGASIRLWDNGYNKGAIKIEYGGRFRFFNDQFGEDFKVFPTVGLQVGFSGNGNMPEIPCYTF